MKLREELDLYANVVSVRSLDGLVADTVRHKNIDLVVIREQTEGEYSALEHESVPGVVESLKITTRVKSDRIAKFAFDYASRFGRKQVTAVHKANIMKVGDGLFLESCGAVAKMYPDIKYNNIIIANCAVFEQGARHTFGEAAGKNMANPTAMLLCAANMLNHVGLDTHGERLTRAVNTVIKAGKIKTRDIGGYHQTNEFTQAVIRALD